MDSDVFRHVVVIGTGMMGPGIAQVFAAAGKGVTLVSRSSEGLARGLEHIEANLASLQAEELASPEESVRTLEAIRGSTDLAQAVAEADLVVESIVEELTTKQNLFAHLDRLCPESTILVSNTSGLRVADLAAAVGHRERVAVTHFWNPPHLLPLVEIVKGEQTSDETVQLLKELLEEVGKKPIVVRKDVPGQLGNRILHAILREAMYIVQEGIATAEEVDVAIKNSFGLRFPVYGPMEGADVAGVDLLLSIQSYLAKELCGDPEPLPLLQEMVGLGEVGVKAGKGFYDWGRRDPQQLIDDRDAFVMAQMKARRGS